MEKKKRKALKLPNSYGGITKVTGRRRKKYRVRVTIGWTPEGKQIVKSLGYYETRREAMEVLSNWNVNPLTATDKVKKQEAISSMTFSDMYDALLKSRESKLSEAMRQSYQTAYKNLAPLHGQIFNAIKKPHLQSAFDECEKSSSTKNKMKVLVNALYKYAIEHELTEKDYSKMIDMEPKKNEEEHEPFTEAEIETIWTHANDGDEVAMIILLQIYTGTRIRELLEIKKENVHLSESYMIGGKKTEAGKNRIIPLHKRIIPLMEYFHGRESRHLFTNNRGTAMQYGGLYRHFNLRMEAWGMTHTSHDARRTAATRLHVAGVDLTTIQQILGHAHKHVTGKSYIKKDVAHLVKHVNWVR